MWASKDWEELVAQDRWAKEKGKEVLQSNLQPVVLRAEEDHENVGRKHFSMVSGFGVKVFFKDFVLWNTTQIWIFELLNRFLKAFNN